jgi:phage terminase large subunit-like protein
VGRTTPTPDPAAVAEDGPGVDEVVLPAAAELRRLKISPEVAWYLVSRGIPMPTCPPRWKTPEPRTVKGARFDPDRVDKVIASLRALRHVKGRLAGQPLHPDPWQVAYILAPVYGWVHRNDHGDWVRVIRTEYVDLPRKNGKTTLAGGQALYLTAADGEAGAEVYALAAAKDQARFCFGPVKSLVEKAKELKPHLRPYADRIVHGRTDSYFAVVSSLADLIHGANVHGAVIDELHVHKTRDLVDGVESGAGSRAQPLVIIITTADDGRRGTIYAEKRTYCEQLARGVLKDPTFYGVVWAADPGDDPYAEATWRKANPGYGISPTREFLLSEAAKARQSPANLSRFLRLYLGIRTKQTTRYLDLQVWDRNAGPKTDPAGWAGRRAFGGLDLAASSDLCSLCLLFPADGGYDVLWRHWCPERAFDALDRRTAKAATQWRDSGLLTVTSGDVADYAYLEEQIVSDGETYAIAEVGYDPWNSSQLVNNLVTAGVEMVPVRQGYGSLSAPLKELQRLLLSGTARRPVWRHGGNPLVRWQVDNLAVAMDPSGNVKPDKNQSGDKIDAVAAAVIALARALAHTPQEQTPPPASAPAPPPAGNAQLWRPTQRLAI